MMQVAKSPSFHEELVRLGLTVVAWIEGLLLRVVEVSYYFLISYPRIILLGLFLWTRM